MVLFKQFTRDICSKDSEELSKEMKTETWNLITYAQKQVSQASSTWWRWEEKKTIKLRENARKLEEMKGSEKRESEKQYEEGAANIRKNMMYGVK